MNDKMTRLWATKTPNDEWWSSFVTAPIAVVFNYLVVDIKWLTPNLVTLASFVTALIAAVLIVIGGMANFILAAALIQLSHVFDCMDGQMARYRQETSASGSLLDQVTDQLQVSLWFGAAGFAAAEQSERVVPIMLALIGLAFYSLRGYAKYVEIHIEVSRNNRYLQQDAEKLPADTTPEAATRSRDLFGTLKSFTASNARSSTSTRVSSSSCCRWRWFLTNSHRCSGSLPSAKLCWVPLVHGSDGAVSNSG